MLVPARVTGTLVLTSPTLTTEDGTRIILDPYVDSEGTLVAACTIIHDTSFVLSTATIEAVVQLIAESTALVSVQGTLQGQAEVTVESPKGTRSAHKVHGWVRIGKEWERAGG